MKKPILKSHLILVLAVVVLGMTVAWTNGVRSAETILDRHVQTEDTLKVKKPIVPPKPQLKVQPKAQTDEKKVVPPQPQLKVQPKAQTNEKKVVPAKPQLKVQPKAQSDEKKVVPPKPLRVRPVSVQPDTTKKNKPWPPIMSNLTFSERITEFPNIDKFEVDSYFSRLNLTSLNLRIPLLKNLIYEATEPVILISLDQEMKNSPAFQMLRSKFMEDVKQLKNKNPQP